MNCKACPDNAICYGLNNIAPRPGNFRKDLESDVISCRTPEACNGGNL